MSVPGQDTSVNDAPTFSFLTSAFRSEDTVGRTISAVLDQSYPGWGLIVVDNGHTDTMLEAVSPFLSDPRIHLVRQGNRGAAGGRMRAAEHARGRYLVVLNSDDFISPDFARPMADFLGENPGVAAATCDAMLFVDPGQRPLHGTYLRQAGRKTVPDPSQSLRVSEVIEGPCPFYTAPIRRDVWDALGGMSGLEGDATLVDDLDFWLRSLTAGYDVRMLPDTLDHCRMEAASISRPFDPAASEELEEQLKRSLRRAVDPSGSTEDQEAYDRAVSRLYYWQAVRRARVALREGRAADACEQYRLARAQRRTVRAVVAYAALRLASRTVLVAHRVKRRVDRARGRAGSLAET